MKIELIDGGYIIYLNKLNNNIASINDCTKVENVFRKIFKRLQKYYQIKITGYYNIFIYLDKYYGAVLKIVQDDFDYYDSMDNDITMRIKKIPTEFWYEVDDYETFANIKHKLKYRKKDGNFYILIKKALTDSEYLNVLEMSKINFHHS